TTRAESTKKLRLALGHDDRRAARDLRQRAVAELHWKTHAGSGAWLFRARRCCRERGLDGLGNVGVGSNHQLTADEECGSRDDARGRGPIVIGLDEAEC